MSLGKNETKVIGPSLSRRIMKKISFYFVPSLICFLLCLGLFIHMTTLSIDEVVFLVLLYVIHTISTLTSLSGLIFVISRRSYYKKAYLAIVEAKIHSQLDYNAGNFSDLKLYSSYSEMSSKGNWLIDRAKKDIKRRGRWSEFYGIGYEKLDHFDDYIFNDYK